MAANLRHHCVFYCELSTWYFGHVIFCYNKSLRSNATKYTARRGVMRKKCQSPLLSISHYRIFKWFSFYITCETLFREDPNPDVEVYRMKHYVESKVHVKSKYLRHDGVLALYLALMGN